MRKANTFTVFGYRAHFWSSTLSLATEEYVTKSVRSYGPISGRLEICKRLF